MWVDDNILYNIMNSILNIKFVFLHKFAISKAFSPDPVTQQPFPVACYGRGRCLVSDRRWMRQWMWVDDNILYNITNFHANNIKFVFVHEFTASVAFSPDPVTQQPSLVAWYGRGRCLVSKVHVDKRILVRQYIGGLTIIFLFSDFVFLHKLSIAVAFSPDPESQQPSLVAS